MKNFIKGALLLPSLIGLLFVWHVLIATKESKGIEITNRIARLELAWLAMNKPFIFCEHWQWVCLDVEESKE